MSKLVTIYGGSGFVGRYVARRMAKLGWRVRVAVRRPNEAIFVKPYGVPGQVEPVLCNIRDEASVRRAMIGADAVVNCVGTFDRGGRNNMDAVAIGAGNVARAAAAEGVAHLVHVSAIGASAEAASRYGRAKAEAERLVLEGFPQAVILRPAVIFGNEDGFFNRFAGLAAMAPVLPITGGATVIQPVHVEDVAEAVVRAATGQVAAGVLELGGPEALPLRQIIDRMLEVIQRKRVVANVPAPLMKIPAFFLDLAETCTGRLFRNGCVSRDQIDQLSTDITVAPGARGFDELGITPTAFDAVVAEYLWPFRPSGQYAAIKASAKNLKKV